MNKTGSIGALIVFFIGVIVALAILPAIADGQSTMTSQVTGNETITTPANGSWIDLVGQELFGTPVVYNQSSGTLITGTNYTIEEGISSVDGKKTVRYKSGTDEYSNVGVNVTYTYGAEGYVDDRGGRSIAGLIVLFAAIGLMGFAIFYGIARWIKA